jgi:hypothetical protein
VVLHIPSPSVSVLANRVLTRRMALTIGRAWEGANGAGT